MMATVMFIPGMSLKSKLFIMPSCLPSFAILVFFGNRKRQTKKKLERQGQLA